MRISGVIESCCRLLTSARLAAPPLPEGGYIRLAQQRADINRCEKLGFMDLDIADYGRSRVWGTYSDYTVDRAHWDAASRAANESPTPTRAQCEIVSSQLAQTR